MIFGRRKSPAAGANGVVSNNTIHDTALSWEASRIFQIERSERRAWNIVKLLGVTCIMSCAAIVCLMPLKTVEPFVIKVDTSTGMSELLHIANTQDIPVSDVMNKYWISQYVRSRETYDWRTLDQDYVKVRELSLPNVFKPYNEQFGTHDESLEVQLKDNFRVLTELKSIVINTPSIATVRFTRKLYNNRTGAQDLEQHWTATIGFEYFPDFTVSEERRLINPFGFKVTSYRVDPEIEPVSAEGKVS